MKLKLTCSALLIFFFISVSNLFSQFLHFEKLSLRESSVVFNDSNRVTLHEKSPLLAGSLSFIVPGLALGQLYNGQHGKFIRHAGISTGCIFFTYLAFEHRLIEINIGGGSKNVGMLFAVFFIYLGNWVWSVMDAAESANEINKQIKLQKSRSDIMNKIKFGFTVNKNKQLNLKFAFEL